MTVPEEFSVQDDVVMADEEDNVVADEDIVKVAPQPTPREIPVGHRLTSFFWMDVKICPVDVTIGQNTVRSL